MHYLSPSTFLSCAAKLANFAKV
ncbi:hypothetical protein EMIT0111MI5_230087 [Burkholderia sp. IT-111MI5]